MVLNFSRFIPVKNLTINLIIFIKLCYILKYALFVQYSFYFLVLGFDRLLSIICQEPSIRDVIAFPKSNDGKDPMSKAPATISIEEQNYYHIQTKPCN